MKTFLDETYRKRPTGLVVAALAAAVAVTAGVVVALAHMTGGNGAATPTTASTPSATVPVQGLRGPVKLLKGTRMEQGIAVGYPHTVPGGISAGAEYLTQVLSNLNEQRARQIAAVIADPSFTHAQDYLAQGPANLRQGLGLPTSGPLPTGVSQTFSPAAYQLRDATDDSMTVLILAYLTNTTPDGQVNSTVGAYPIELHWDGTDWKVLRPGAATAADYSGLAAQPATADAAAKGWQGLSS